MSNKIRLKKYLFLTFGFIMAVAISFIGVSAVLESNRYSALTCLSYYTDDGNYINSNRGGNVVLTNTNSFDNNIDIGEEVSICANANLGYTFVGFYSSEDFNKDSFITNSNPYKLTVEENTQIYANFAKNYNITLEVKDEENNPKSTITKTCYFGQEINVKKVIAEELGETTAQDYSNSTPTATEETTGLEVSQNTIKVGAGATTLSISPSEPSSVGTDFMLVKTYYTDNGTDFLNSLDGGNTSYDTSSEDYTVRTVGAQVYATAASGYTFVGWYKETSVQVYTLLEEFQWACFYNDVSTITFNNNYINITAFFAKNSVVKCWNYSEKNFDAYTITIKRGGGIANYSSTGSDIHTCDAGTSSTLSSHTLTAFVGARLEFSKSVRFLNQTTDYLYYTLSSSGSAIDYSFVYAPKYEITLNDNDGEDGDGKIYVLNKQGIYSNSACTISKAYVSIPTQSGYTFNGYYSARSGGVCKINSGGGNISNSGFTENTTFFAQWTAGQTSVTLDQAGGTGGTTGISPAFESAMPEITLPTRTGYIFKGYWSLNSSGELYSCYYNYNGASNQDWDNPGNILRAKWEEIICTINLSYGSGITNSPTTVLYQKYNTGYFRNYDCNDASLITSILSPTKSGANYFGGYFTETNGNGTPIIGVLGNIVGSNTSFSTTTATIYAHWLSSSNIVNVHFKDTGSAFTLKEIYKIDDLEYRDYISIPVGNSITLQLNTVLESDNGNVKKFLQGIIINDVFYDISSTGSITFTVTKETYIESFYYRVYPINGIDIESRWKHFFFWGNGGSNSADQGRNYLSSEGWMLNNNSSNYVSTPVNSFKKTGYKFAGWGNTQTSPTEVISAQGTAENWPLNSYAKWVDQDYWLSYELNGGTVNGTNPRTYYKYSNDFTLINPTKTGYTFIGWTSSFPDYPNLNITVPTLSVTITKGSTYSGYFYANWEISTYKITFNPNGGTISNGKTLSEMPNSSYSILIPSGKYILNNRSIPFVNGNTYYLSCNFYCDSGSNTLQIQYFGGTNITSNVAVTTNITQYNKTTLVNNSAQGISFYNQSNANNVYINNIKVYAVTQNLSTDCLFAVSGVPVDNVSVPTRQGYSFNGYFSAASGGTKYYNADGTPTSASGFTLSGDITLYAQWTIQSYTPIIKVYLDGVEKTNATEIANIATYVIPASMTNGQTYTNLSVTFKNQYTHDTAENRGLPKINFAGGGNFTSFELTSGKTYTISSIPCSGQPLINIYAKLDTKILTINKPTNGTLTVKRSGATLTSPSNIYIGESLAITITPSGGYVFESLTIVNNGVPEITTTATTSKTITVNGNVTISATFKAKTFTLSWSVTNGNMSDYTNNGTSMGTTGQTSSSSENPKEGILSISYGQNLKFSFTSIVGYSLPVSVTINGTELTITRTNSNRNGETDNFAVPNLTNGATISFSLSATANTNTAYKVEHYVMNTSGSYPSAATSTDNLTGKTDTSVILEDKINRIHLANNGIQYDTERVGITTANINGDGNTVIKLYYKRLLKTVTISKTNCSISVTRESDSTTVANNGTVYYEDRLAISFSCGANYTMITKKINGSAFSALTYDVATSSIAIVGVASMIVPTGVAFTFDESNPSDKKAYISGFSTNSTSIVLPNTVSKSGSAGVAGLDYKVVGISANAFKNRTTLQSVTLNANIKSIGESAFENCTALTTIDLTNATTINSKAFYKCTNLGQIKIGTDATISELAFGEAFKPKAKTVYINDTSILADIVKSNWYATNGNDYGNLLAGATKIYVPKNAVVSTAISQNRTKTTEGDYDIYSIPNL